MGTSTTCWEDGLSMLSNYTHKNYSLGVNINVDSDGSLDVCESDPTKMSVNEAVESEVQRILSGS